MSSLSRWFEQILLNTGDQLDPQEDFNEWVYTPLHDRGKMDIFITMFAMSDFYDSYSNGGGGGGGGGFHKQEKI